MPITNLSVQMTRENIARDEWIAWRMQDVPSFLTSLMPVTADAAELMAAEQELRRVLKAAVEQYQAEQASPWKKRGTRPQFVKYDGLSADEKIAMGLTFDPPVGMPAWPKGGEGIDPRDGQKKLYADFIEVREVEESPAVQEANRKACEEAAARGPAVE